jgi:hypothetical protein
LAIAVGIDIEIDAMRGRQDVSARVEKRAAASAAVGTEDLHHTVEVGVRNRKEVRPHNKHLALLKLLELRASLRPLAARRLGSTNATCFWSTGHGKASD